MDYEDLEKYFQSDEDSLDASTPSIMESGVDESNSEVYNIDSEINSSTRFTTPLKDEKSNFYEFNNYVLEVDEKGEEKEEQVFDLFSDSDSEYSNNSSKYSDNSSFTWGNGNKVNILMMKE